MPRDVRPEPPGVGANLRAVDLNLLPVLRELLRARNVTRAAEHLGMSQSAVSEALKRLRHQLDDQILVRVGRSMTATNYALSLAAPLEQVLGRIEAVMTPQDFDPHDVERRFVIATADSVVLGLAPALINRLADVAPKVAVHFVDLQWVDHRSLEAGVLDLVILPSLALSTSGLHSFPVYQEDFVVIARRGGPATVAPLTAERFDELATIAFRADPQHPLSTSTRGKSDVLRIPQFVPQAFLVQDSDAIALVPRHLAERMSQLLTIEILEPPFEFPTVEVRAFWGPLQDTDPTHRWFRQLILDLIG
jgi:LysR family transcriptional regulator, nod-box dependent transcriptional activator